MNEDKATEDVTNIIDNENKEKDRDDDDILSSLRQMKISSFSCSSNEEFNVLLDEMKDAESLVRKELTKLPFNLSTAASKRRNLLMKQLKDIKERQQQLKKFRGKKYINRNRC